MIASEQHLFQTIVQFDKTIVLPRKHATGSIHDYLFCYCPLLGILFEVLRITVLLTSNNYSAGHAKITKYEILLQRSITHDA